MKQIVAIKRVETNMERENKGEKKVKRQINKK